MLIACAALALAGCAPEAAAPNGKATPAATAATKPAELAGPTAVV